MEQTADTTQASAAAAAAAATRTAKTDDRSAGELVKEVTTLVQYEGH